LIWEIGDGGPGEKIGRDLNGVGKARGTDDAGDGASGVDSGGDEFNLIGIYEVRDVANFFGNRGESGGWIAPGSGSGDAPGKEFASLVESHGEGGGDGDVEPVGVAVREWDEPGGCLVLWLVRRNQGPTTRGGGGCDFRRGKLAAIVGASPIELLIVPDGELMKANAW
jgi:hypothetical protein